jgi:hypothetical protein
MAKNVGCCADDCGKDVSRLPGFCETDTHFCRFARYETLFGRNSVRPVLHAYWKTNRHPKTQQLQHQDIIAHNHLLFVSFKTANVFLVPQTSAFRSETHGMAL